MEAALHPRVEDIPLDEEEHQRLIVAYPVVAVVVSPKITPPKLYLQGHLRNKAKFQQQSVYTDQFHKLYQEEYQHLLIHRHKIGGVTPKAAQ